MKYHVVDNKIVRKYTIKEIFRDNWHKFEWEMEKKGKPIRKVIREETVKIIDCQNPEKGYAIYLCPKCNKKKTVPFTCKSRFCNSCGVKYSKDRSLSMSAKLLDCAHRHVVFTIPQELRPYFAFNRSLLDLLFKSAANTLFFRFNGRNKGEDYTPGFICVLHTFGRDLKWNPHIHVILCTEAVGKSGIWKGFNHINYEGLRRSWQFSILKFMAERIQDPAFKQVTDRLYAEHKNGFYVNAPPIKHFSSGVINYIVRYAGRPVLAQSRIKDYNGDTVSFTYTPHGSDELVSETLSAFDFIKRLIIHIPDRNFKMIRYYGFYLDKHSRYKQYLLRKKKMDSTTLAFYRNAYKSWRKRIYLSFHYDPLKCSCGSYFELIDICISTRKIRTYLQPDTS
jgi:hypothetical protein